VVTALQTGYDVSLIAMAPIWVWPLLAALCFAAYHFRADIRITVTLSTAVATILLFLPSFLDTGIYGPDSYQKIGDAQRVVETGMLLPGDIYPGPKIIALILAELVPGTSPNIVLKLMACLLGPVAMYYLASQLRFGDQLVAALTILGAYAPLGWGIWLTARSTYHSFFLGIPAAILFLGMTLRLVIVLTDGTFYWL
jgi:hypothetical protein